MVLLHLGAETTGIFGFRANCPQNALFTGYYLLYSRAGEGGRAFPLHSSRGRLQPPALSVPVYYNTMLCCCTHAPSRDKPPWHSLPFGQMLAGNLWKIQQRNTAQNNKEMLPALAVVPPCVAGADRSRSRRRRCRPVAAKACRSVVNRSNRGYMLRALHSNEL